MSTSAGVIIIDATGKILMGFPSGGKFWDLPKGGVEENETDFQGAIREVKEETGLDLSNLPIQMFSDLGKHRYNKRKQLHLYLLKLPNVIIDTNALVCTSMVIKEGRNPYPEMSHFEKFSTSELENLVCPSMYNWLKSYSQLFSA